MKQTLIERATIREKPTTREIPKNPKGLFQLKLLVMVDWVPKLVFPVIRLMDTITIIQRGFQFHKTEISISKMIFLPEASGELYTSQTIDVPSWNNFLVV